MTVEILRQSTRIVLDVEVRHAGDPDRLVAAVAAAVARVLDDEGCAVRLMVEGDPESATTARILPFAPEQDPAS